MQTPALDKPFQVLDHNGQLVGEAPDLPAEKLVAMHRFMWLGRFISDKIVAMQRQGRAGTFGPLVGQEATAVGLAAPLKPQDWLAGSYREIAAYLVKGVRAKDVINTIRGYPLFDKTAPDAHCLPIQIVIGTQMPHAVGLAMAAKIRGDDAVAVGICGDGATSEGDFNESLNFAGVFKAPAVIVITNNGWAISMPRHRQSAARSLADRGIGFGVPAYLVDGNDILGVYKIMNEAAERARAGYGPTLIECLTYRIGAHTTADDPTRYRPKDELDYWKERDPIARFRKYLLDRNILDEASEKAVMEEAENEVAEAVRYVDNLPVPPPDSIFDITFEQPIPRQVRQREEMRREMEELAKTSKGRVQ